MAKSDEAEQRELRLAAKLRENLRRRKQQLRRRSDSEVRAGGQAPAAPAGRPAKGQ